MAASSELRMDQLPSDPLLHVLSFLNYRDLVHCSYVNRRLNELSKHNPLWKSLCSKHWLLTDADRLQSGVSWYCLFKQYYRDLGRYIQYYPVLKRAWEQLKSFLQQRCPRMIASLKEGATEVELNDIEAQIGCRLPDDYRCSYRIHNGQKLVIPGLMGSMSLSNHYRSEVLLDVETAAGGFQQRKGMRRCLPLTFCFHTGLSQYMALQAAEGRRMYESFYPCPRIKQHEDQMFVSFQVPVSWSGSPPTSTMWSMENIQSSETRSSDTSTIKDVWRPLVTSPSQFLPPSCQSCPPSILRTSSSPTGSGLRWRAARLLKPLVSWTAVTGRSPPLTGTWRRFRGPAWSESFRS
ncbi:F-box only protein 3 isoform X2 [Xyrichtys novacula]|uniref:F-box only protein 3 isoform X2 n=1 Tax=Xyrichtys novacula TaxID=13765 RepID=A0AAV1HSB4_XYRNO|nr:F-box only protein 3 isoform X2 [Xyrichtys novacula]